MVAHASSPPNPASPSTEELAAAGLRWLERNRGAATSLDPMAGDVSVRSYFRVGGGGILAHYPPELRRSYECFLRSDELLRGVGVATPDILLTDPDRRWMLTRDVGCRSLFDEEDPSLVEALLGRAADLAARIATLPRETVASLSPALEGELLTRELRQTATLYFRPKLGASALAAVETVMFEVCARLDAGAREPAHRDFMARNLMIELAGGGEVDLVVLDHQDLRMAPRGYDLASLFHDSCPLPREEAWRRVDAIVGDEGREAVARCAVQRCLKIVGTFVAFARRGRTRYLEMVPRALSAAALRLAELPESTPEAVSILEECAASGPPVAD